MLKKHFEKIVLAAAILILAFMGFLNQKQAGEDQIKPQHIEAAGEEPRSKEEPEEIFVHLTGEIKDPGVISLKQGDRLVDAIQIAGGHTSNADMDNINLALKMEDEMKIHIPKIGEMKADYEIQGVMEGGTKENLVNINNATKEELMTLPSIGEIKAQKIIDFREKQKFEKKEDLKNVSGIGDKTYEELEELITI
ncbi:helix-hairpin-helix domain-containing protein [Gallicola sp. Sow4_E12]|uniref:ComEA family DNA-binding protein n=1 Tax=Gallicola sp. Sow4_E12 TaxID=3438785 RepID=UPI003F929057